MIYATKVSKKFVFTNCPIFLWIVWFYGIVCIKNNKIVLLWIKITTNNNKVKFFFWEKVNGAYKANLNKKNYLFVKFLSCKIHNLLIHITK